MYCRHWSVVEDNFVVVDDGGAVAGVAAAVDGAVVVGTAVAVGTVVVDTVVVFVAVAVDVVAGAVVVLAVAVAIHEMQERIASGDTEEELPPCPHCPLNPPFPRKQCAPHRAKDQA